MSLSASNPISVSHSSVDVQINSPVLEKRDSKGDFCSNLDVILFSYSVLQSDQYHVDKKK